MTAHNVRSFTAFVCFVAILFAQSSFAFTPISADRTSLVTANGLTPLAGTVSLTTLDAASTQDFDTLSNVAASTTNNLTIPGWYMTETGGGARDNEQYAVDTGASTTGDTYSYGTAAATDRALGALRSGTLIPVFGASFTNNTGSAINSLDVAYVGEQWRLGTTARTDQINFEFSTNATDLATGTWSGVSTLNFVSPDTGTTGAKNGNGAANRTAKSSSITGLSIADGATFWVRWTDTDASGADDGLSVDDFSLTPHSAGGSTNPSGTGLANPSSVAQGGTTLLTVTVTPGTGPASTGITVTGDLSAIGGSATQTFFDNGTNGDVTIGDNIFSYQATVDAATTAGAKILAASIADAQLRTGSANISLTVTSSSTPPTVTGSANPSTVQAGNQTLLTATVTPGANPVSTGITATVNLTTVGGSATQTLFNDGSNGDVTPGDNIYSYNATTGAATSAGVKSLAVTVNDAEGRSGSTNISLTVTAAPATGQPLPFAQNWSNTSMITVDDDWSGVPGIIGYRGDSLTGSTGTDPQTIVADGSAGPVDVVANQTDTTLISGGVYEFQLADPVIGFQGSGTADAPNLVISLNTTGHTSIAVSYNLRDLDGSTDNAIQPVALQYRVGSTGNYTNIPAAFVADATEGPGEATLVTPVLVALPAAAENQPLVQLRIITTNAVGNDEFVGVDDINVASGVTIPLSGVGSANPSLVTAGSTTLLKVAVGPASGPASRGIAVTGDLSSIGGSATQMFFDDGTNGDVTAGDDTYSYSATVAPGTVEGSYSVPFSVTDAQSRTSLGAINLTVGTAASSTVHLTMGNPSNAVTDVNTPNNYLLSKTQYVMSYNRDEGKPNWVSWHLNASWIGSTSRQNDFRPDTSLPAGWYQVTETDFSGSGFDRGHHTPSGDRTASIADNSATFFMSNMMAQAPDNNQGPWEQFESYCRTVVGQGSELYIIAGSVGQGGVGSNGGVTNTVAGGHVVVPSYTWKVAIILPNGNDDVSRVTNATRTIGIIMPNRQGIRFDPWQKYLASVDQVEALTGYDFFSNVSPSIQAVIESSLDPASNTSPQTIAGGTVTDLAIDGPNTTLTGNVTVNGVLTLGGSTLTTGANKIILGPNASIVRLSGMVNGSLEKQFGDLNTPAFEYAVGTGPFEYSPVNINLTALGTPGSSLTVTPHNTVHPNAPDPTTALKRYWTLTESGDLSAQLTFHYVDRDVPASLDESTYRIYRYEPTFAFIPSLVDPAANTASTTNSISDFSDWTLLVFAPSAAPATVSGRVTKAGGIGVSGAAVTYSDSDGHTFRAITNPFGYYSIDGVPVGRTYVATVTSKRATFESRVFNVSDSIADADFESIP